MNKKSKNLLQIFVTILLLLSFNSLIAQGKFYINSSVQMIRTEYQNDSKHNSFFFYNGIRYQTPDLSVGLSFPVVFENNSALEDEVISDANSGFNGIGMMDNSGISDLDIGIGDIYFNGSYRIIKESLNIPAISFDGYIRVPTATPSINFGTKTVDVQIGVGLRKAISKISFFGQFGYLMLGTEENSEINNPLTFNAGLGYSFGGGRHSVLAAYDSYSTIIEGVQSFAQIAFGYNYLIHQGLFLTTILSSGLNNSTADYTISGGLNIEL